MGIKSNRSLKSRILKAIIIAIVCMMVLSLYMYISREFQEAISHYFNTSRDDLDIFNEDIDYELIELNTGKDYVMACSTCETEQLSLRNIGRNMKKIDPPTSRTVRKSDEYGSSPKQEDISCYFNTSKDDLPPFDNEDIDYELIELNTGKNNVRRRHIFFHETSCRGDLTPRQACTIESASRAHSNWTIYVLFSAPISTDYALSKDSVLSRIALPNVKLRRIHISEYVKGTPIEKIVSEGLLNSSKYRYSHASDILRFTTLYKHPGVYLDLDLFVVKPLDNLARNFAIQESIYAIAVGALGLDEDELGRSFSSDLAEELSATFNGKLFGHNGPMALTRVLRSWCDTRELPHMNANICQGFSVYRPAYAYPIESRKAKTYFEAGSLSPRQTKFAYMFHVWGKVSQELHPHPDSPFHQLAKKYCPVVYNDYKTEFGWQ